MPDNKGTYRGICVQSVLGQLLDCVLYARAGQYVEQADLRAPVQCGFRPGHGTLDALFTMQHLITKHRFIKKVLYVCYVDFEKAFDLVRREEVIARARQLGMTGSFLKALEKWLVNSSLSVCVNGQQGAAFPTHRGTKQGGRLSPLLFGLFVEQLHELLKQQVDGAGPMVGNMRVPDILYADDVKLLTNRQEHVQQLLDALDLFCALFDMRVNVSPQKTCIVVYGKPVGALPVWTLGGKVVPVCGGYTDLGVKCTSAWGLQEGAAALAVAGRRAMHAALTMCKRGKLVQPAFKLRLFDAVVEPVLAYGCQVWGPWAWSVKEPLCVPAEKVHLDFLRIMAGAGKQVKQQLLMCDFARYPISYHWVALAVRWWDTLLLEDNSGRVATRALRDDVQFMLFRCTDCWSYRLLHTLTELGVLAREQWDPAVTLGLQVADILQLPFTEQQVKLALQARWDKGLSDAQQAAAARGPRHPDCPGDQILLSTYVTGVRARDLTRQPLHLSSTDLTFAQLQRICRMRLGWHSLAITAGRFRRQPRGERVCQLCAAAGHANVFGRLPVEDVAHHLVECRSLQHVRERYPQLFMPDMLSAPDALTMCRFVFNYKDQRVLARALLDLRRERDAMLAGQQPQQPQPEQQQPGLLCPRLTAFTKYVAEQQRRRADGVRQMVDWY